MTQELTSIIESAWDSRDQWNAETIAADQREAIMSVLAGLNNGSMRVAEKTAEGWLTHQWIKKAVLLSFRLMPNEVMKAGPFTWYDKLPVKFHDNDGQKISESGIRAIPGAIARYGSFIEPGAVLMPSFVNVGARVGSGTMVDTWATVGSCAQVGKNCHLSGGVGIGGVLEPVQAGPTIIEDNCFIGARSEIVEGVVVEENSVISMGVFIGQPRSTTAQRAKSCAAVCRPVPWSSRARCRARTALTTSTAPSSSSVSMPRPAPRPPSTICCATNRSCPSLI